MAMAAETLTINLHEFIERTRANGPGERAVVWVQGCPRRCASCWNPSSLPFTTKNLVTVDEMEARILAIPNICGTTFSGGEPFSQAKPLAELARRLKVAGHTIVCYTGHTLEALQAAGRPDWNALLAEVDLLVDGEYVQSQPSKLPLRGSTNQRLHYLSGRIRPEEVETNGQVAEFVILPTGQLQTTGFPDQSELEAALRALVGAEV